MQHFQRRFAERLNEIMPCKGDKKKTYFANSGAECLGVTADSALDALYGLLDEVLPRKPLREFGAKESDLTTFASEVPKTQQRLLKNNYVPLTEEQIHEIYKKVF